MPNLCLRLDTINTATIAMIRMTPTAPPTTPPIIPALLVGGGGLFGDIPDTLMQYMIMMYIYNKQNMIMNTVFDLITTPVLKPTPLDFFFIFTYYRPLDDLLPNFLLYFHLLLPT